MAASIPEEGLTTQVWRRAAVKRIRDAGAVLAVNLLHGMWDMRAASGMYDRRIPIPSMLVALSGCPLDCTSPVSPRLLVKVPDEMKNKLFPWLKYAEAAYAARVVTDARFHDKALL